MARAVAAESSHQSLFSHAFIDCVNSGNCANLGRTGSVLWFFMKTAAACGPLMKRTHRQPESPLGALFATPKPSVPIRFTRPAFPLGEGTMPKIGRASCRERDE